MSDTVGIGYHRHDRILKVKHSLLPTGSEERGVFRVWSIPVRILPFSLELKTLALQLHKHEYGWRVKNKKHLRGRTQATIQPLAIILTAALWALVSILA